MNIPNIKGLVKVGRGLILAHRSELLFGASLTATVSAVVLAAKGGYEAGQRVLKAEHPSVDLEVAENPLDRKEIAQLTWGCYVPAAAATVGAVAATTGLHLVHVKEKKALAAAALAAAEEVKNEANLYKKHVEEILSDEQKHELGEQVQSSDSLLEDLYLVRDAHSGRDIYSNKRRIEDAVNEINSIIAGSGDVDLNTFYGYAGFNDVPQGLEIGWSGGFLYVNWSTTLRDDGQPVAMFSFQTSPEKGFDRPV